MNRAGSGEPSSSNSSGGSRPVVGHVGATPLDARRFVAAARFLDLFQPVLEHLEQRAAVREASQRASGPPTVDELQAEADAYRRVLGLHKAQAFSAWLDSIDYTLDEFEEEMELRVQRRKKRASFARREIEACFREERADFDRARISQLVVATDGLARELVEQANVEKKDFARLAAQHSLDEATRDQGGLLGWVRRRDLAADVQAAVFAAAPGKCVAPVALGEGAFQVVLVHETRPATLDAATEDEVRDILLARWVDAVTAELRARAPR